MNHAVNLYKNTQSKCVTWTSETDIDQPPLRYISEKLTVNYPFSLKAEWFSAWLKHHKKYTTLLIHTIVENNEPIALFPLVKTREKFFSLIDLECVKFIGWNLAFYKDLVVKDGEYANAVSEFVKFIDSLSWDFVELNQIKEKSPTLKYLLKVAEDKDWLVLKQVESICPYVEVGDWHSYWRGRNKSLRKNIKWLLNKGFSFKICNDFDTFKFLINTLVEFHIQRFPASKYKIPRHRDFLYSVGEKFLQKDILYMPYLMYEGELVAICIGYKDATTIYYATPAFNQKYNKFSPGKLLLFHIIKYAFDNNYRKVDLLVGKDPYKYLWATGEDKNIRILIFPRRLWWLYSYYLLRQKAKEVNFIYKLYKFAKSKISR